VYYYGTILGVSCSADRQAKAKITAEGIFLEQLETNVAQYLPEVTEEHLGGSAVEAVKVRLRLEWNRRRVVEMTWLLVSQSMIFRDFAKLRNITVFVSSFNSNCSIHSNVCAWHSRICLFLLVSLPFHQHHIRWT